MTLYALGATTVAGYRLRTGDTDTEASAVSGALVDAETQLGEELRRDLALEARTATMRIFPDGRAYPPAWPLTTVDTYAIDGRAIQGAVPDSGPFVGVFSLPQVPRVTVTWTGGYDATTLPVALRDAIYDLAHARIYHPTIVAVGAFAGGSASVGDVSVGGTSLSVSGGLDSLVPGLWVRVRKYRNRYV